ncbi:ArsR/SmtB family transcription factor [Corynebacterium pseudodiphtheriticum]|uniref:ArsR/SmtB family transcription factor n=1 Tax=Corynebacterium pseudodiphtheriticum TaxID=37637 RepID=UPI002542C3E1|nr:metalloregulator ArsR/SmtB family transcription factor [Corynebacterium pseudodiphtheriticum]MDK4241708.1 metalloregulator ArsR/SmtB family transcription factor [Corynebacterium pseudodiphtheriticum]
MPDLKINLERAENWSATFRTLGDVTRLKLLTALHFAGPYVLTVSELAETTGVRVATCSAALRAMELNGTVTSQRHGRSMFYAIKDENAHKLLHCMGSEHES